MLLYAVHAQRRVAAGRERAVKRVDALIREMRCQMTDEIELQRDLQRLSAAWTLGFFRFSIPKQHT